MKKNSIFKVIATILSLIGAIVVLFLGYKYFQSRNDFDYETELNNQDPEEEDEEEEEDDIEEELTEEPKDETSSIEDETK